MPVKRRLNKPANNEGASAAPSAFSNDGDSTAVPHKRGGLRVVRREMPVTSLLYREGTELAALVQKITASGDYGEAFRMANDKKFRAPRLATGIFGIDLPLGGGWSMGRASMVYGERSAGKSTIALLTIAAQQRLNPDAVVMYVDVEGTFDDIWAAKLGCDTSRIVVIEPESGEHAVDLIDAVIRTLEVSLVVNDSVAMLIPMKEIEAVTSQEFMGLQARLIGKLVRRCNQALLVERKRDHLVHLMHINQFRMKVGLVFGDPRSLPGGKALEYSTSQQMEAKNKETMFKDERGDEVVKLNEHSIKISKNKSGGPLRESMFRLIRTEHEGMPEGWIDQSNAFHSFGTKVGLVDGPKQSFSVDGVRHKFKGAADFNRWAVENRDVYFAKCQEVVTGYRKLWSLE